MSIPKSCMSCPHSACCNSAMGMSGCHFYQPKEKKVSWLKKFFSRFFSK